MPQPKNCIAYGFWMLLQRNVSKNLKRKSETWLFFERQFLKISMEKKNQKCFIFIFIKICYEYLYRTVAGAGPTDVLYGSRDLSAAYRHPGGLGPHEPCPSGPGITIDHTNRESLVEHREERRHAE